MNGPQGIVSSTATYTLDEFATHIAHVCAAMRSQGKSICEPSKQAEAEYCQVIYDGSLAGRKFFASCTPGYYSNEGEVDTTTKSLSALYPEPVAGDKRGRSRYFPMLKKSREEGTALEGFDVI